MRSTAGVARGWASALVFPGGSMTALVLAGTVAGHATSGSV
ncbi:hypothetical protein [Nonomuraea sp. LPB2021202275-12-8]